MNPVLKQIISRFIPVTIILVTVYTVLPYIRPGTPMVSYLNNTTLWWAVSFLILGAFMLSMHLFFDKKNRGNMAIVWAYLIWNLVCIARGVFVAETYWDWRGLIGNTMVLLLPVVIFSATNKLLVQSLLSSYIQYALPFFLLFALLLRTDAFGFYLIPVSFLLLFFPAFPLRQKVLLLCIALLVIFVDLAARSNVIKFGSPLLVLVIYYYRKFITLKMLEAARIALFVIPFLLFALGVTGVFNIFNIQEYLKGDLSVLSTDNAGNRVELNVMEDTRTGLYEEVLESAINNNYWLLGRTPARGNDSYTFGSIISEITGRYERLSNEIGLANVFTWTGIVGVLLYMLLYYKASFLAVHRSRNIYAKMLGIFVAFRWFYSWVEDVNDFSANYFMLMVMFGLCFSESFRKMTSKEVVIWVRGMFDGRYVKLLQVMYKKKNLYAKKEYSRLADVPQPEN